MEVASLRGAVMKARPSAASIDVRGESRLSRTACGDLRMRETEPRSSDHGGLGRRVLRCASLTTSKGMVRIEGSRACSRVGSYGRRRWTSSALEKPSFELVSIYGSMLDEGGRGAQLEVGETTASEMTARSGSRWRNREIAEGPRRAFIDARRSRSPQRGCPSRAPRQSDLGCQSREGRVKARLTHEG